MGLPRALGRRAQHPSTQPSDVAGADATMPIGHDIIGFALAHDDSAWGHARALCLMPYHYSTVRIQCANMPLRQLSWVGPY